MLCFREAMAKGTANFILVHMRTKFENVWSHWQNVPRYFSEEMFWVYAEVLDSIAVSNPRGREGHDEVDTKKKQSNESIKMPVFLTFNVATYSYHHHNHKTNCIDNS